MNTFYKQKWSFILNQSRYNVCLGVYRCIDDCTSIGGWDRGMHTGVGVLVQQRLYFRFLLVVELPLDRQQDVLVEQHPDHVEGRWNKRSRTDVSLHTDTICYIEVWLTTWLLWDAASTGYTLYIVVEIWRLLKDWISFWLRWWDPERNGKTGKSMKRARILTYLDEITPVRQP